jgi:hypothetical protein
MTTKLPLLYLIFISSVFALHITHDRISQEGHVHNDRYDITFLKKILSVTHHTGSRRGEELEPPTVQAVLGTLRWGLGLILSWLMLRMTLRLSSIIVATRFRTAHWTLVVQANWEVSFEVITLTPRDYIPPVVTPPPMVLTHNIILYSGISVEVHPNAASNMRG